MIEAIQIFLNVTKFYPDLEVNHEEEMGTKELTDLIGE